ncbi:MAG: MBL fold metallo-hydrolase [Actinomycetota bacterium]|nr:MBL fold metallo-hydrolase [Actinomycetota bacterium]
MTRITYVGHSTVLIEMNGARLLTDPVLRRRIAHLRRRVEVDTAALRGVDAVLVSHAHYDHLDRRSLELLGRSTLVVVPRGLGGLLRRRGFERVVEMDVGEHVSLGELTVEATHAEHGGDRPFGARAKALGYLITGSHRFYFAGDTELFDGMTSLAGSLDVAFVPIWGWGSTLGRGGHLDPERAADALALLRPRIAVPIHWGTYHPLHLGLRVAPPFMRDPPAQFVQAASLVAPEVDVRVLQPGGTLEL